MASTPDPVQFASGPAHRRGRSYYEQAMQDLDQDAPPQAVAALLLHIARSHFEAGNRTATADCLEAVFALPAQDELREVLAEAWELRGRLACDAGQLDEANDAFTRQKELADGAGAEWLVALGDEHLASLDMLQARWDDAITRLESAAARFGVARDHAAELRVLRQLATMCVDLKRWNTAEQTLANAVPKAQQLGDAVLLARLELTRATMAIDRANVERARLSAERAMELARRAGDPGLLADTVAMIGIVTREAGDLDRALQLVEDAERQAAALDDDMLLGELACDRVEILARGDQHRLTLTALNRAYRALARLLGETGSVERARRLRRLEETFLGVTAHWAARFEGIDHDTTGHVERVTDLTCEIARRLGVDPASMMGYRVGACLHDLGKLAIPGAILNKRGRLTADEWATVKRHPVAGAELLAEADFPWEVRPIVESHHECWDGSGYPHGRAGEEIPLAARIFCVADVYDALVTRRPFKHALEREDALEVMRRDVGRQFDPAVFHVFEDVIREGIPIPGIISAAALANPVQQDVPLVDDALTSVATFTSWSRKVSHLMAERRASGGEAALILIDLDDFSRVNRTYGRLQGDDVLWAVAKVLQRGVRGDDLVARRAGDEFVVYLPQSTVETAREVAERLRESIAGLRCTRREGEDESIAVSACLALVSAPADGDGLETLIAAADRAIFRAKQGGRDQVVESDRGEPARAHAALDFSSFVGREEELRHLTGQLDLAARSEPRVVGLTGEAGIGKTSLVRQLEPEVRLRAGWLAMGTAAADGMDGPLGVWVGVVTQLAELGGADDRAWQALPQWLPDVFPSVELSDAPPVADRVQAEIVALVRRAARVRPVVIVLEDMHQAGAASWAVLDALVSGVDDERLLLVFTTRPEVPPGAAEWRRRIQQHARTSLVPLRRFGLEDVRRWIRLVFHDAAPGDDVARWLHDLAEGIPRFVLHLLHAACDDGTIWYGGTRWEWQPPDRNGAAAGLSWVMERRLERLSPSTRQVLAIAALLAPVVSLELLVSVSGVPEAMVRVALEEAVTASVMERADEARDDFTFRHPLLVESSTRGTPERERQRVHDLAARMLELRTPSALDRITAHYHAAGNDAAAMTRALQSAERMLTGCAHDAALDHLQIAQRYASSSAELALVRTRQAEVAVVAGRFEQAAAMSDLALEWLDRQPPSELSMRARRTREWVQWRRGKAGRRSAESFLALLDETATVAPSEFVATAVVAADAALERCEWGAARQLAQRALGVAHAAGDVPGREAVELTLGVAGAWLGAGTLQTLEYAVTPFRLSTDPRWRARALHALADVQLRQQAALDTEDLLVLAIEAAREGHAPALAGAISRTFGIWRTRQGEWAEAQQWFGDAERLFTALEDEPGRVTTMLANASLFRLAGERSRAHGLFEAVAHRGRELDTRWLELAGLAGAALSNGGPTSPSSRERWERIQDLLSPDDDEWCFPGREYVDAVAIQVALSQGNPGAAAELYQRAASRLDRADRFGSAWLVVECEPGLRRAGIGGLEESRRLAREQTRRHGFRALSSAFDG